MKKFLVSISFFGTLLSPIAYLLFVLIISGEMTSVHVVAYLQKYLSSVLYGAAYSDNKEILKKNLTKLKAPDILALGSSRVMQIHGDFFVPEAHFFNAGGSIHEVSQYRPFLNGIPETRLMIVGIDPWFFLPNRENFGREDIHEQKESDGLHILQSQWQNLIKDRLDGKWKEIILFQNFDKVGIAAKAQGRGFNSDGFYDYGVTQQKEKYQNHLRISNTVKDVETGRDHFAWNTQLGEQSIIEFRKLLTQLGTGKAKIIFFLPPYSPSVWMAMEKQKNHYLYIQKLRRFLEDEISHYDRFLFFDFCDPRTLGMTDERFIDGFHGSKAVYAKILEIMALKSPDLAIAINRENVRVAHQCPGLCAGW